MLIGGDECSDYNTIKVEADLFIVHYKRGTNMLLEAFVSCNAGGPT